MSRKHEKVCTTLILASATICISVSVFASLLGIPVGITSSVK